MRLTDTKLRSIKPDAKPRKLFDGGGLYLLINPNGSRWWRLKYRVEGREKTLSLGVYPDVSLAAARVCREEARKQIFQGDDPSLARQAKKASRADTFEAIANEWMGQKEAKLASVTANKTRWMLETFVYPYLGKRPIRSIKAPELLAVLRRIEARGKYETAHRTKQKCGEVFRYAIATGRAERDVTADLRGALASAPPKHRAAITRPSEIGELLRAIDDYRGQPATACALKLAPLLFVRPGELRQAEWTEFDIDAHEWRIPKERMKMREQHVVPLSRQAVELLKELHSLTGHGKYVFPALHTSLRPMSENTLNLALRRLGYSKDEMTAHGFRSMASTCLNEQGWHPDVIELQLAHKERNKVRAAYNRAQRIQERRAMMQDWADYLDALRSGSSVVAFKRSA